MIGLGVYLYYLSIWKASDPPIEPIATWFPVACIFIFTITCTLGYLVVPWVMIGELYPQKVRGIVGGMTTCMAHIFVFLVVKTYPFLTHALYRYGVFFMYGCISLLGKFEFANSEEKKIYFPSSISTATVVLYVYLPETKGKTLQEIEDYFSGRTASLSTKKPNMVSKFDTNVSNNKEQGLIVEKDKLLS